MTDELTELARAIVELTVQTYLVLAAMHYFMHVSARDRGLVVAPRVHWRKFGECHTRARALSGQRVLEFVR